MDNKKEEIEICFKVISKYFIFLSIAGAGFVGMLGVSLVVESIFGSLILKAALIIIALVNVSITLTIFTKFAIIKALREE